MDTRNTSPSFYVNISGTIVLFKDVQEVYNELRIRLNPWCEIGRFDSLEEGNFWAHQNYGAWFHGAMRAPNERMMRLPIEGEFALCSSEPSQTMIASEKSSEFLPISAESQAQGATDIYGGVWGIHYMNGFGLQGSEENMLNILCDPQFIYPVAQWFPTWNTALAMAWNSYSNRFYMRYSGQQFFPAMPEQPLKVGEMYIDKNFAYKEEHWSYNEKLSKFASYGLIPGSLYTLAPFYGQKAYITK